MTFLGLEQSWRLPASTLSKAALTSRGLRRLPLLTFAPRPCPPAVPLRACFHSFHTASRGRAWRHRRARRATRRCSPPSSERRRCARSTRPHRAPPSLPHQQQHRPWMRNHRALRPRRAARTGWRSSRRSAGLATSGAWRAAGPTRPCRRRPHPAVSRRSRRPSRCRDRCREPQRRPQPRWRRRCGPRLSVNRRRRPSLARHRRPRPPPRLLPRRPRWWSAARRGRAWPS